MLKRVRILSIILAVMLTVSGCSGKDEVKISEEKTTAARTSSTEKLYVDVCGQVKHPGVYEFSPGDRVVAAIKAAGGFTSRAAAESINQAEEIKDGQQIYVPSKKEISGETKSKDEASESSSGKVNINSASQEELMTLSGIGEAKASDIIAYRQEHGPFSNPEDIMKIQGIKEGVYNKIKDKITI